VSVARADAVSRPAKPARQSITHSGGGEQERRWSSAFQRCVRVAGGGAGEAPQARLLAAGPVHRRREQRAWQL